MDDLNRFLRAKQIDASVAMNGASASGGGVYAVGASSLNASARATLVANSAPSEGGAIYLDGGSSAHLVGESVVGAVQTGVTGLIEGADIGEAVMEAEAVIEAVEAEGLAGAASTFADGVVASVDGLMTESAASVIGVTNWLPPSVSTQVTEPPCRRIMRTSSHAL